MAQRSGTHLPLEVFHTIVVVEEQVSVLTEALWMYVEEFQNSPDHRDRAACDRAREVLTMIDSLR